MNLSMSTLRDLKILKTDALICHFLKKDLVDLALAGLRSSYREKLDGSSFYSIN